MLTCGGLGFRVSSLACDLFRSCVPLNPRHLQLAENEGVEKIHGNYYVVRGFMGATLR